MKKILILSILISVSLSGFSQWATYINVPQPRTPIPEINWNSYDFNVNPFTGQRYDAPPKIVSQKIVTVPAVASSNFKLGVYVIKIKIVQYDNSQTTTTPIALKYPGENEKFRVVM